MGYLCITLRRRRFFFLFKLFLCWLRNLRDAQALKANTNEPFIFGKEFFLKNSARNVCVGGKGGEEVRVVPTFSQLEAGDDYEVAFV